MSAAQPQGSAAPTRSLHPSASVQADPAVPPAASIIAPRTLSSRISGPARDTSSPIAALLSQQAGTQHQPGFVSGSARATEVGQSQAASSLSQQNLAALSPPSWIPSQIPQFHAAASRDPLSQPQTLGLSQGSANGQHQREASIQRSARSPGDLIKELSQYGPDVQTSVTDRQTSSRLPGEPQAVDAAAPRNPAPIAGWCCNVLLPDHHASTIQSSSKHISITR